MKVVTALTNKCDKFIRQCQVVAVTVLAGIVVNACDSSGGGIDPGVVEIPIAYINRPIPADNDGDPIQADLREPLLFSEGGDLFLADNSTAGGSTRNLTRSVTGGMGDVKGLSASSDGRKIVFSVRLFDPDPNDDDTPTWNVYEYDLDTAGLRRIITSDLIAEQGDDLYPAYLPDGRIVFTSNRQRQAREMLINEGRPTFSALDEDEDTIALTLHVMNDDGTDIHQISFNQSHDLFPQVLHNLFDGQIVFSRWDNAAANNEFNLYKTNPDGSGMELVYGARSHATGTNGANIQFARVREMQNGDLMVIARPFTGTFDGGDIWIIDADRFVDTDKPIWSLAGLPGPGQRAATTNSVLTNGAISPNGRYHSVYPLWDGSNRILVSKSTCQVQVGTEVYPCIDPYLSDPAAQEVSPAYSLWIYDMNAHTQKVMVLAEPGRVITEAVALRDRGLPAVIADKGAAELDAGWEAESVGVVNIRSVYDMGDGTFNGCFFNVCTSAVGIGSVQDFADPMNAAAAERPARFVRFVKAVGLPDPNDPTLVNPPDLDNSAFGPSRRNGMREIVGYAPVEPDGSVKVKVPANVALAVEVLDSEGRRIGPRHLNWFQVQPGDTLECNGCHDLANGGNPPEVHSRADARAPSINSGLPATLQFANTLIPGTASPNPYWGDLGQTMAEVRFDRVGLTVPASIEPRLSPDLIYDDYWTDPAVRAPDASYAYEYANLDTTIPSPLNSFCTPWQFNCRTVINYEQQIHPLWQLDRGVDADMNMVGDDTCTECHTTTDAMNNDRVADAQLDLTDGASDQDPDQFKSYRELLFTDQEETLVGGMLQDLQVPDGMGGQTTVNVAPSMRDFSARASYFIEKMTETELDAGRTLSNAGSDPNYVDHSGMLSNDELKLISEWLDLGAQYFNDPFDPTAPQN